MDIERSSSSVIADDTEILNSSSSENCDNRSKEKCELIYEVNAICNMDNFVSEDGFPDDKSFQHFMTPSEDQPTKFIFTKDSKKYEVSKHKHLSFHQSLNPDAIHKENLKSIYIENSSVEQTNLSNCVIDNLNKSNCERSEPNCYCLEDTDDSDISSHDNQGITDQIQAKECENSVHSSLSRPLEDSKRASRRNSKRKKEFDECCPICGVTVRINDLKSHYNQEVERLSKIPRTVKKSQNEVKNEIYEEVKMNRESRLTARVARYKARAQNEVKCPVCSLRMSGTDEEINKHVAICIQDEDSDVVVDDDEGNESYEEYEFGDQTRIRTISLVPGGYRSLEGQSSTRATEDEEVLNVDVDDPNTFGNPQYSELDVIPNTSSDVERTNLDQLRKAVIIDSSTHSHNLEHKKWSNIGIRDENFEKSINTTESDPVVSSLKEKIKDLEDQDSNVKCLICLESYTKPVVSTTCWHVHCEECWLMTMGVKKLCPQCNMIVFPSDLRKIYL